MTDSPPPPVIDFWFPEDITFGTNGLSHGWINLPGRVTAEAGLHDLRAKVPGMPQAVPLPVGPTAYRLAEAGDFNAELDPSLFGEEPVEVIFIAMDKAGQETRRSVHITLRPDSEPTLPYTLQWTDFPTPQAAAQVVDGPWEITPDGLRNEQIAYDRIVTLGSRQWADFRVETTITVHAYNPDSPIRQALPSCGSLVGLILRWDRHQNWHDLVPYRGYKPFGAMAIHVHEFKGLSRHALYLIDDRMYPDPGPGGQLELNRPYRVIAEAQSRPGTTSAYRMKWFPADEPEPDAWLCETEGLPGELSAGSIALLAHQCTATFGPVVVSEI